MQLESTPVAKAEHQPTAENIQPDKIEKFIERVIDDAKARPLVANVAIGFTGLGLLSSLSTVPSLVATSSAVSALNDRDYAAVTGTHGFASTMMIVSALSMTLLASHAAAVHGLYKMRRYGIYAVGATGLLAVGLIAVSGPAAVTGIMIPGALFYFLWNEREKFA